MSVILITSKGDITLDLYPKKAPNACKNFLSLCKIKFFNNCLFFNVQKDFIAQCGDPTNTGTGGESIFKMIEGNKYFSDEFHPLLKHNKIGTLSMANIGKDTNQSQFFITTTNRPLNYLNNKNTIFGIVSEGLDVISKINEIPTDENGKPFQVIRVKKTVILFDPFENLDELKKVKSLIPPKSPPHITEFEGMIGEDEDIHKIFNKPKEELEEFFAKKKDKTKSMILEMVGDIPEWNIKPSEKVLFVCKLNPETQEGDLGIIFSKYGKVTGCNVIKDRKTGNSLCYGFVEFATVKDCENAYYNMQNVIVDDRKIIVDFSQSVSKTWKKRNDNIEKVERVKKRKREENDDNEFEQEKKKRKYDHKENEREYTRLGNERGGGNDRERRNDRNFRNERRNRNDRDSRRVDRKYYDDNQSRGGRGRDYERNRNRNYDRHDRRDNEKYYERNNRNFKSNRRY